MAFNGSGVFVRLYNWVNDAAGGIKIRADRMDNEMNGFATGLSNCITKDGQTTVTANLPMAGYRHTGVGNATARSDYATFGQFQDGNAAWVDGGGTADAITASYSIPITALVDGQMCYVRATAANATTTPTFSPSALTARTIVKNGGAALAAGDIAGDGHELILRYDLTNTRWELLNPKVVLSSASVPYNAPTSSVPASIELLEATGNGTNKMTVTTDAALSFDSTFTIPSLGGIAVLTAIAQTLSNKTLTSPVINTPVLNGDITGTSFRVVQRAYTQTGAVATGTTTVPLDDTIPQITEGDEYMTVAITPKNASSILDIDVTFTGGTAAINQFVVALFRDSTANALAATFSYIATGTAAQCVRLRHQVAAGSTSATTFRVRAGAISADTLTFNGQAGNRRFGGISLSSIVVTEYSA